MPASSRKHLARLSASFATWIVSRPTPGSRSLALATARAPLVVLGFGCFMAMAIAFINPGASKVAGSGWPRRGWGSCVRPQDSVMFMAFTARPMGCSNKHN
jgi:hypothetical protein